MKTTLILKQNIKAILTARNLSAHQLAQACRRSDSWISKILKDSPHTASDRARGIPLKHLDAIARAFGIEVYQLFQPGIGGAVSERRSGTDRRSGTERRINARRADLPQTPMRQIAMTGEDEAILEELHALDYETYQRVKGWITVAKLGAGSRRRTAPLEPPPQVTPPQSPPHAKTPRTRRRRA